MIPPRWRKVLRDALTERWRLAWMVGAVAASLAAVAAVLGAADVLSREMARNTLATRPADATIELGEPVTPAVVARVAALPGVAEVEAGEVLRARIAVGDGWKPALLFVVDDAANQRIAAPLPAPGNAVALERTAAALFSLGVGDTVRLRLGDGAEGELSVDAVVHDPGLAPAWQERTAYLYVPRARLEAAVGRPVPVHDLRLRLGDRDPATLEARTREVAAGLPVHQLRVPPFEQHPHQRQMTTVLALFVVFAGFALVLSGLLVATSLAALLARQVRELAVLKTIGATRGQIAAMVGAQVGGVGLVATAVALPVGLLGAAALSGATAALLNLELADRWPGAAVALAVAACGLGVPLALSAVPLRAALAGTVREALDQHGVSAATLDPRFAAWPRAVRSRIRRPARLALSLGLLGAAGATFVTARSVSAGWDRNLAKIDATRFDDVEVRFAAPVPAATLAAVPGGRVEAWDFTPATFAVGGVPEVSRAWPDRGHGSLARIGAPLDTRLLALPVTAGRWLDGTPGEAVLNQGAAAQRGGVRVGEALELAVEGRVERLRVVGLVEEIGSPGAVYVARRPGDPVTMLRAGGADPAAVEAALDAEPLEVVIPRSELTQAVGGHLAILVQTLTGLAGVLALVGGLGLASTTAIEVAERTREIGVWKTLGATPAQVTRGFVTEALLTGAASAGVAFAGAVPLTLLVGGIVGRLGFVAPLPFVFSGSAAATWSALVLILSAVSAAGPALRAGALPVREALAEG